MKAIEKALILLEGYVNYSGRKESRIILNDGRAELAQLRENLRGIEWVGVEWTGQRETGFIMRGNICPVCRMYKELNHNLDCWLGEIIGGE